MSLTVHVFLTYLVLMDSISCPGAYRATQGPKLVPLKKLSYNLSSPSSIAVAPTLMAWGELPGEYSQASRIKLPA